MPTSLTTEVLDALRSIDTCLMADAIERTGVRLRNEGYANSTELRCHYPELPPMLGYAVTLRVRSGNPPMTGGRYPERLVWWDSLQAIPSPRVLVIEDLEQGPGRGAYIGETHAAIFQAMGCVGIVTNGSVRSLVEIERRRLPLFSASVSPSHAYVHVVEAGVEVAVAGLKLAPGELIHGDRHGLLRIPAAAAAELPALAERLRRQKQEVIRLCDSASFSPASLHDLVITQDLSF